MRVAGSISRYLLGILFTVFGANGFLNFLPAPPPPPGLAGAFHAAMTASHYLQVVYFFQFVCGVLLLIGRFVPLALVVLAAILVNIVTFHVTMEPKGLLPGLIATALWAITAWNYRDYLELLFAARAVPNDL